MPPPEGPDFDAIPEDEKIHYYRCKECGGLVDMRQLDEVLFHEDHKHRPDIPYSGWERLN
jgi:hypothetical protein